MGIKSIVLAATTIVLSTSANSAIITENFTTTVASGDFVGTVGTGTFTYDDLLLTGVSIETISAQDGLTVEFSVFGQTFTEQHDFEYPNFPELRFLDGGVIGLNFAVKEGINGVIINQEGVSGFGMEILTPTLGGGFEGELFVQAVPLPAAVWLFGSGLIGLIGIARRKRS